MLHGFNPCNRGLREDSLTMLTPSSCPQHQMTEPCAPGHGHVVLGRLLDYVHSMPRLLLYIMYGAHLLATPAISRRTASVSTWVTQILCQRLTNCYLEPLDRSSTQSFYLHVDFHVTCVV